MIEARAVRSEVLLFHTDSRNYENPNLGRPKLELPEMRSCHTYSLHIVRISRAVRAKLDLSEVLGFQIQIPRRPREFQELFYFIHIRNNMRINRVVRLKLDLSEVLLFHTDSRNYENSNPWAVEARTPRNAIMSHIFVRLWVPAELRELS